MQLQLTGVKEPKGLLPQVTETMRNARSQAYGHNGTVEQRSVDVLYSLLAEKRIDGEKLSKATLALHRAGFGLLVYKHPRPGVIHVYNKKFGLSVPLSLDPKPELGHLIHATGVFV